MIRWPVIPWVGCALLLALFSGCSTTTKAPNTYTFFPPSPDEPHIQFLTSFASDADLGRGRTFADYITGEQKTTDPLIKPYGLAVHDGVLMLTDFAQPRGLRRGEFFGEEPGGCVGKRGAEAVDLLEALAVVHDDDRCRSVRSGSL